MKGSIERAEVAITKGYGKGVNAWIIRAKEIIYEIAPNGLITLRITEEKDVVKVKEGQRGGISEDEKYDDDDARRVNDGDKTGKRRKRINKCSIEGCSTSSHGRVFNVDRFGPPGYRCCRHGGGRRCSIEGCSALSEGRVPNVDRFGPPGHRCC